MGLMDLFSKTEIKEKQTNGEKKNDNLLSDSFELESQDSNENIKSDENFKEEKEDENIVIYHDTLESKKPIKKQTHKNRESYKDQNIWRDVESIEKKVDNLHVDRAVKKRSDLDKKVDGILKRKK